MRTYKHGSKRLGHEENATSSRLRWLGILSDDVLPNGSVDSNAGRHDSQGQLSQETESQDSAIYSLDGRCWTSISAQLSLTRLRFANLSREARQESSS